MAVADSVLSYYGDCIGFQSPYFDSTTTGSSPLVPGYLTIAIAGRGYLAETSFTPFKQDAYRSDSIAPVADKTDISNIPGYGSVGTEGLWRRIMNDWTEGAGQEYLDRDPKVEQSNRFYTSKGIYPWQPNRASLLNDVVAVHSSGAELQVLVVGAYVYINDNGTVRYSTGTLSSWTAVSGVTAALTSNALATDGNNVYIAAGSGSTAGIYLITSPGGTAASWITGATINYVWYAGGQLLAAGTNLLYAIFVGTGTAGPTAIGAAGGSGGTALLYTHPNAHFVWKTAAAGNSWIYVGGSTSNTSANFSIIYKTAINAAGTALAVPITAATLPGGELVTALYPYANFILVGTSLGARFCETLGINDPGGNAGDLKMGPIVPDQIQQVSGAVQCFTGQFRFVWFGWSNYDSVSTGLGRMDLSTFVDQQAPAYTSDLMVTGAGAVVSMDWYNGLNNVVGVNTGSPVFVVAGAGVYTAATTFVAEGIIDTGIITAGLPDKKIALFADFKASGSGAVSGLITVDGSATFPVPSQNVANQFVEQSLPTSLKGEEFDFRVNLFSNSGATATPVLRRLMLKFLPAVVSGTQHKVIINLFKTAETLGVDQVFFPYNEFAILDGLRQSATPVQFQEGSQFNVTVVIKSITRLPYNEMGLPEGGFQQRLELVLQTLEN
jgi:hypothetical protein